MKIHSDSSRGYDIEFKPGDTSTIYASGNLIFKSTDGGASFEKIQAENSLTSWMQELVFGTTDWVKASANQNNTIAPKSGSSLALFYHNDYSEPITKLISPQLNLSGSTTPQLKFSFANVIWGTDLDELKVFYKTGLSQQWTLLQSYTSEVTTWQDITIDLPNPTSDYYIAFEGKSNWGRGLTLDDVSVEDSTLEVIFSDNFDQGSNYNNFSTGPKMIGVSADNPEVVYVLEANSGIFGGFYKSTDSGANFVKLDHTNKNYFGYSSNADDNRGQAPRDMDVIVNPNDAEDVHIAGILSWRSTNGGTDFNVTSQWVPENAEDENIGYCHADIDLMIYHNNKIYVGSDGGIFVANDPLNVSSTYYTDLSAGLGIRQFYKIGISQTNPVIVTGGSQDNGTSVYRADGIWYDWLGADGMETFIDHSNPGILYGTSQYGYLYKSLNQGQNYFGLPSPEDKEGSWVTPFEQDPQVATTIYAGYDEVYKSEAGGENVDNLSSWVSISQNFENNLNHLKIAASHSNTIYAAFGENLYRTISGGSNGDWAQLTGLGMGDLEVSELILSPNPSTGIFKLNWELQTQVTIKIYDSLGKLVFYEKSRDLSKNSEIELKASKGIYFLKVNSLNQEITKKLIIN